MDQAQENREERAYWFNVLREHYKTNYGLDLDPAQSNDQVVPPLENVVKIQHEGKANPDVFFATGYCTTLAYLTELRDYGYSPAKMANILEMGVGLGRLIIHYFPFKAQLFGCDVTPDVAAWTRSTHGQRVQVSNTKLLPPLPYPDGKFDFVYANSVFTHIPISMTAEWAAELRRIIRPGGVLIFSVFDSNVYLPQVSPREFHAKYLAPGGNEWEREAGVLMMTYLSRDTIYNVWGRQFEVLEIRSQHREQSHVVCRRRD